MFTFRPATKDDAESIASKVVASTGGLVDVLLGGLIPGLSSTDILSAAFSKGEGPYRVENVICSYLDGKISSLLFAYSFSDHKVTPLLESFIPAKRLAPVRSILETAVENSLYINTLWLGESVYDKGYESALLLEAETRARSLGLSSFSLFCWNDNAEAMARWNYHGFSLMQHLDSTKIPVENHEQGGSILYKKIEDAV